MEQDKKHSTELSTKIQEAVSFFDKNEAFVLAFKKTEKLASAVYMVTSLFSENEPMKWNLRKKVSEFLSFTLSYKDTTESSHADFVYKVKTDVLEIVSLLEISSRGGLVSAMNLSILKQEFMNLAEGFVSAENTSKDVFGQTIPKNFFNVSESNRPLKQVGQSRDISADSYRVAHYASSSTDVIKDKAPKADKEDLKRSNRQNVILTMIKKKGEITIKDVSQIVKDCSEKTIQRELIAFITAGVLKKTGERRWSKYSLIDAA